MDTESSAYSHVLELLINLFPIELVNVSDHDLRVGLSLVEIKNVDPMLIGDVPCIHTHGFSVLLCGLLAPIEHVAGSVEEVLGVACIWDC